MPKAYIIKSVSVIVSIIACGIGLVTHEIRQEKRIEALEVLVNETNLNKSHYKGRESDGSIGMKYTDIAEMDDKIERILEKLGYRYVPAKNLHEYNPSELVKSKE